MMTTDPHNPFGLMSRQFDTLANKELDCRGSPPLRQCVDLPETEHWGKQSTATDDVTAYNAVYISNGSHYGLFLFEGNQRRTVTNLYSLETFLSNVSSFVLLFRWCATMTAMLQSYRRGVAPWQTTDIGCLSGSRTFFVLPLVLLPRMKQAIAAFWSIGISFEGQQRALAEAWFAVYPAIIEVVLFVFSLLNGIAKLLHRRMSDALFGPTIVALAVLHYLRNAIVNSGCTGFDGRISTAVLSAEFERLRLVDLLTPDVAMRMNGNVPGILYLKVVLLALNVVPLVWSRNLSHEFQSHVPCRIEKALAFRASRIGGLGQSAVYALSRYSHKGSDTMGALADAAVAPLPPSDNANTNTTHRYELVPYELSRLGYFVVGGKYLLTYDDWAKLAWLTPLRNVAALGNFRISVFDVARDRDGIVLQRPYARLCRLADAELRAVAVSDITVCAFR